MSEDVSIDDFNQSFGFTVGEVQSGYEYIVGLSGGSWVREPSNNALPNQSLKSVFLLNNVFGFAVGNQNYTNSGDEDDDRDEEGAQGTISATILHAVACEPGVDSAADHCWAVGNRHNNDILLLHWDGSSWTRFTDDDLGFDTKNKFMYGISCNDTHCYAVGLNSYMLYYNGNEWSIDPQSEMTTGNLYAISVVGGGARSPSFLILNISAKFCLRCVKWVRQFI